MVQTVNSDVASSPPETEMWHLEVSGIQEQFQCVKIKIPAMVFSSGCTGNITLIAGLGFGQLMSKESSMDRGLNYPISFNLVSSHLPGQWD